MVDRIVVTFAGQSHRDIPWPVAGDSISTGDRADLPAPLRGVVRLPPMMMKKAAGADELRQIIQVAIDVSEVVGLPVAVGLLTNWLYDTLKRKPPAPPNVTYIDARTFIGHTEVNVADRPSVEAAFRQALTAPDAPEALPPQIAPEIDPFFEASDEDDDEVWVEYWMERGRQREEELARRIEEEKRRNKS